MKVEVIAKPLAQVQADAVVIGMHAGERRPALVAALDAGAHGLLRAVLDAEKFQAKAAQVTHVHTAGRLPAARVVVVGLGERRGSAHETLRRAASAGVRRARDLGARAVAVQMPADGLSPRERAQAVVEGAILGTYAFDRYKKEKPDKAVETLSVLAPDARSVRETREGASVGEVLARATWFARDLVNEPANEVNPTHLARVAAKIAKDGSLDLKVYDRAQCEKMGMGAFLGVAQGSEAPPKFIHLTYTPSGRARKRVAVIGKGITFDAGGLDLKTAEGMLRMKDDMSGAAAVLAVFTALPALKPAVEVHGVIPATENMPSGSAFRPGDILRAMNGTTIEIGNTDAEGRLTLADALCYAREHVKAQEMIDLATLTSACVVALGPSCSGVMTNNQPLADRFLKSAERAGERMWQLPLIDEYREHLKSEVADLNNVGPRGGGAITAGLFLKEFAGDTPWIHLDIAGPAFVEKAGPLTAPGATGAAVRSILGYLLAEGGTRRS
ncbi:MAG: leucyl aminopeptidase [Candidatus Rokubacteria bacterium]|nr:leucyl aminopeptidase [Candidatus Rokubacteria bacterium]MBI3825331.1 leucyl aminopeptidase [Candidatus Rokubacteria bacterium]